MISIRGLALIPEFFKNNDEGRAVFQRTDNFKIYKLLKYEKSKKT